MGKHYYVGTAVRFPTISNTFAVRQLGWWYEEHLGLSRDDITDDELQYST